MPTPNKNPLNVSLPVDLTGKLIKDMADRIETIKPIEKSDEKAPIKVVQGEKNGGLGTDIVGNMKAYKVSVCVNGEAKDILVWGRVDQDLPEG